MGQSLQIQEAGHINKGPASCIYLEELWIADKQLASLRLLEAAGC